MPRGGAVGFALAQVGDPYRWGATGPHAWDCSGLVIGAYAAIGVRGLPHSSRALLGRGRPVTRSAMRAGDLVFPSPGHVGIYLGGGRMVHAPQPGQRVKVADVYAFYAARRL